MSEENKQEEKITGNEQQASDETISSGETIVDTQQPETNNDQPATENMEVHHPPNVEKKNFKEYFLEFLMIFLAVTMGFFAENIREELSNNSIEKEYMSSMIQDLNEDSLNIEKTIRQNQEILHGLDTLVALLSMHMTNGNIDSVYAYSIKYRYDSPHVDFSERTLSQLKNSGALRFIKNQKISDAVATYDQGIRACNDQYNYVTFYYHALEESEKMIFDYGPVKPLWDTLLTTGADAVPITLMLSLIKDNTSLRTKNPDALKKYIDEIIYDQVAIGEYNNVQLSQQLKKASMLVNLIKENYHLE